MILNNATDIKLGQVTAQAVYSRLELVWPSGGGGTDSYIYEYLDPSHPDESDIRLTYYTGDKRNPTIPTTYGIYNNNVVAVAGYCFSGDSTITSATIEAGVTQIE